MASPLRVPRRPEAIDGSFLTRDGLALSMYRVPVSEAARGPVVLIHGLGDHSRSMPYLKLGAFLAEEGFEVFAFDRRGSGRSAGPANYATSWEELRDDLSRFVDLVEDRCGNLPALIGLSLGGLQALDFALERPESVRACVAMAPALDVSGTSPVLRAILPVLARFFPRLEVDPGLDLNALARDPAVGRAYRDDPLWRVHTTPALAHLALEAIVRVQDHADQMETPLLILHGTADRVVPIQGTKAAFPRFGSEDKTFIELPGAFHALPIDFENDDVEVLIADWLKARSRSQDSAPLDSPMAAE